MDLILDCNSMKYPYTGLFEYCKRLGSALQNTLQSDDQITYYIPKEINKDFFRKKNSIIQKSTHKYFPVKIYGSAIWHTTYQLSQYMKNGGEKVKRVLTVHDLNFLYEKSESKIKKYMKLLQNNTERADYIITISNFVKKDLTKQLKIYCPISVIYNGCHVSEFPNHHSPIYYPKKPFLFSMGTILPKKNFHILPCLLKNNDYELIIAGKGTNDYTQKIVKEATKHSVRSRVKIIGIIHHMDKYWYLKNCTAFLFPSLAEGFGIPPIEAMHFGKPVFLSTHTSLPEIGGNYAYYFNDFDSENMCRTFESGMNHYVQAKLESMIKRHADQFNWWKSAKEYRKVYDLLS